MTDIFLYDLIATNKERISNTSFSVNLDKLDFSPRIPFLKPNSKAWVVFSSIVHHSKFSTLLSVLMPFLWLINFLLSGLGIKDNATNLCKGRDFSTPLLSVISTRIYPYFVGLGFKNLFNRILHNLPKEEVLYNPSYPTVGSNFSNTINKNTPLNIKDCDRNLIHKEAKEFKIHSITNVL